MTKECFQTLKGMIQNTHLICCNSCCSHNLTCIQYKKKVVIKDQASTVILCNFKIFKTYAFFCCAMFTVVLKHDLITFHPHSYHAWAMEGKTTKDQQHEQTEAKDLDTRHKQSNCRGMHISTLTKSFSIHGNLFILFIRPKS